ncbi:MAG: Nif11-like leader peptide family RiPP precursor [Schwartzia sp.]|nr:Nif11-like leader peptide family RiPP precursor [Schwartzia sp. (in: firmicutes)]
MANINVNELTQEQIEKALACQTAEELMAAAKEEGFDLTKEEADAYMAEMADLELDDEMLRNAAGGGYFQDIYQGTKKVVHKML